MMNDDEKLRQQRLVFYTNDIEKIDGSLKEFLELSKAKCALLIDKDGHLVTKHGETGNYDMDTISALVAGSFAATKEMAKLLGEEEFSVMFHQGASDSIQLTLIGNRTILATIFDDQTTIGMIRLYSNELAKSLLEMFNNMVERQASGETPENEEGIDDDFDKEADGKLDNIFG